MLGIHWELDGNSQEVHHTKGRKTNSAIPRKNKIFFPKKVLHKSEKLVKTICVDEKSQFCG
jgi:hypothetical protein